ncbi:MAG: hypothetical protein KMY55_07250 [Dethiosulfatibacter sp.]|nr:hypothetical protein [Dethiosulfatibacter sp.]
MSYTREEIISKCNNALEDVSNFYKHKFINYRGRTKDTNEIYSEIVAEFVCDNILIFQSIPSITREATYRVKSHDGVYSENSNRLEEITAMQMFNYCKGGSEYDFIGRVIDYQTPLKNRRGDVSGKIDLLSVLNETVFILELKKEDSNETMLKCVLEGFTYLKTIDTQKLKLDFELDRIEKFVACPLVFKGREQWKEMQEDRPQLKRLIKLLDSVPYYVTVEDNKYIITED